MNRRLWKLNDIYKVTFPNKEYSLYTVDDEVFLLSKPTISITLMLNKLKIHQLGLKIINKKSRPTYTYAQLLGRYARDNFITVHYKDLVRLIRQGYIDIEKDIILEDKGEYKVKILKVILGEETYSLGYVIKAGNKYLFDIPRHFEELARQQI